MCFVRMRRAEISKFNPDELKSYEDSVNAYRDIVNAIRTAEKKKYAEGLAEGRATEKRKMLGVSLQWGFRLNRWLTALDSRLRKS